MKTWNDYKEHVRTVDPEIGKDIDEVENISSIVSAMVEQRTSLGLSQRELAAMCGIPQSSVARIESCKTTPNLGTLLNIFQHLGLCNLTGGETDNRTVLVVVTLTSIHDVPAVGVLQIKGIYTIVDLKVFRPLRCLR